MARSRRRGGARRKKKTRSWALEVSAGVAAVTVAGLAVGGALFGADPVTGATVIGAAPRTETARAVPPLPSVTRGGGAPVATAETGGSETGGSGGEREKAEKQPEREARAEGPSKHTDPEAVAYFRQSKAANRVKDIRMVGGYLRIYTDMPESADNSRQALELCETGRDYLVEELGVDDPVIFVQAEFGENGNPILANVLGPDDSTCRVTHPEPGD
ncbi:hypothetical protein HS041_24125 [Planomonospora sp. ID67723]|uniref:hypothetical protein n=1 Tax=Planomonospora sp. ID67723 TaxID=2738134 RepID=UPI0018C3C092|nr:hypothetical protein [Planomonospora sp. ID67723]MBG0830851.1 hypothetical protein [Planomonospora sp. ID67723]